MFFKSLVSVRHPLTPDEAIDKGEIPEKVKQQVNTKYEDYVNELFKDFVKLFGVDDPTQTSFLIMYSHTALVVKRVLILISF